MTAALQVVHGNMGQGKGLVCVGIICEYLNRGCKVATNMDLFLENLPIKNSTSSIIRVADLPIKQDLKDIGEGWPDDYDSTEYDENKKGLLILDEAVIWLNTRDFAKKGKTDIVKYLAMLRKLGWDTYIAIQDYEALDAQVRRGLGNAHVKCEKFSGLPIPIIGTIISVLWLLVAQNTAWHRAVFKTGTGLNAITTDKKYFLGKKYYKGYNTRQKYIEEEGNLGVSTMLPLKYIRSYYDKTRGFTFKSWHSFFIGFLIAWLTLTNGSTGAIVNQAYAGANQTVNADDLVKYVKSLRIGLAYYSETDPNTTRYYFYKDTLLEHPQRKGLAVIPKDKCSAYLRKANRVFVVNCGYGLSEELTPDDINRTESFASTLEPAASNTKELKTN